MRVPPRVDRGPLLSRHEVAVSRSSCGSHRAALVARLVQLTPSRIPDRANANVSLAADRTFSVAVWVGCCVGRHNRCIRGDQPRRRDHVCRAGACQFDAWRGARHCEQPPRVTIAPGGTARPAIVVIWTARGANGTVLLTSRSIDGGQTFSAATLVPGTDAPGNRGWQAIAADAKGNIHAVWLDHRRTVRPIQAGALSTSTGPPLRHAGRGADGRGAARWRRHGAEVRSRISLRSAMRRSHAR